MALSTGKLRILCLHGYTQNAAVFSSRIGSLRKGLKSRAELTFVDGPFKATPLPGTDMQETQGVEDQGLSWWQWTDTGDDARPSRAATYTGWDTTQELLINALNEHKPQGLLGFSQGATAAALFLAQLQRPEVQARLTVPAPSFAILVAGFMPRDPSYAGVICDGSIGVPTLFVQGTGDRLVTTERAQALMACVAPGCLHQYTHPGAHLVPTCTGAFKQALVGFLDGVALCGAAQGTGTDPGSADPLAEHTAVTREGVVLSA